MRRDMNLTKIILLLLVVQSLGCGQIPRRDLEKERQEEKKESAPPTFTYHP
jgi:hypothetical protein